MNIFFAEGDLLESLELSIKIQKLRGDYYETLETNKITGEKNNGVRTDLTLEEFTLIFPE